MDGTKLHEELVLSPLFGISPDDRKNEFLVTAKLQLPFSNRYYFLFVVKFPFLNSFRCSSVFCMPLLVLTSRVVARSGLIGLVTGLVSIRTPLTIFLSGCNRVGVSGKRGKPSVMPFSHFQKN
jgi:hypothetical protein